MCPNVSKTMEQMLKVAIPTVKSLVEFLVDAFAGYLYFILKWIYYLFILCKDLMDTKNLFVRCTRLYEDSVLIFPQSEETDVDFITFQLWNLGPLWASFTSSVKSFLLFCVSQDTSHLWAALWVILSSPSWITPTSPSKPCIMNTPLVTFLLTFASGESNLY